MDGSAPQPSAEDDRIAWLRAHYGDAFTDRFAAIDAAMPETEKRKLDDVAIALRQMFPSPDGYLDFPAALAFFGLPPLETLRRSHVAAVHHITHMAIHGHIPLSCNEWPSHLERPPWRPPLFPVPHEYPDAPSS